MTGSVAADGELGATSDHSPAGGAGGSGGAVWIGGPGAPDLQIADSVFTDNRAGDGGDGADASGGIGGGGDAGSGGAVFVGSGAATITRSTFARNRVGDGGRGASTAPGGTLWWIGGDGGSGGGLAVGGGTATVTNATFQGNRSGRAGLALSRSGFSATQGSAAVAAQLGGSLRIDWSTFAGNQAATGDDGRAVGAASVSGGQVATSILAHGGVACDRLSVAVLPNAVLPGTTGCPGPAITGDAALGALAANGGPTPTLAPGSGSVAVDAIVGVPCPATDQRGLPSHSRVAATSAPSRSSPVRPVLPARPGRADPGAEPRCRPAPSPCSP